MKLATLNDGSRDGQLIVVSRDLSQAHYASGIAGRLQQVLDDWGFLAPQLEELYVGLNHGRLRHAFNFDPKQCMAPLPRAFQWIEGAAYLNHAEVLHKAGQADSAWEPPTEPGLRQGPGDAFLGACSPVRLASEAMGIDFEAQWVAVTGDVAQGVNAAQALEGVRLLMLANGWTLRLLGAQDRFHSRPLTSFSPVAVTPDELGASWRGGRIDGALQTMWNGRKVGHCETGAEMSFHCGQLIAQAAKTRGLRAGSLISTGPVSNLSLIHI